MALAMGARSRLGIMRMEDIGLHCAQTLELWRLAFMSRGDEVMNLVFDQNFLRNWQYYFS